MGELSSRGIAEAAARGDHLAKRLMHETARYLAVGAVCLMHTIDPDLILFSGGMIAAGPSFLDQIRESIRSLAFPVPAAKTKVAYAELGGDAGFIGAAGCLAKPSAFAGCNSAPAGRYPRRTQRPGEIPRPCAQAWSLAPCRTRSAVRSGSSRARYHPASRNAREHGTLGQSCRLACRLGWACVGMAVRAPFVWRIEGMLDHDQSVVGLMALDIAAGRRFPIFFDGQRYMGAIEAYIAAAFVLVRGIRRRSSRCAFVRLLRVQWQPIFRLVALARAIDRTSRGGHRGRGVADVGSLGIVPRGGYIECLAWALPTLWAYRALACPRAPDLIASTANTLGILVGIRIFREPYRADRLCDARALLDLRTTWRGPSPRPST